MSAYFTSNIDIICESLTELVYVSILVGESLVVNQVYRGCIVTFMRRATVADDIIGYG